MPASTDDRVGTAGDAGRLGGASFRGWLSPIPLNPGGEKRYRPPKRAIGWIDSLWCLRGRLGFGPSGGSPRPMLALHGAAWWAHRAAQRACWGDAAGFNRSALRRWVVSDRTGRHDCRGCPRAPDGASQWMHLNWPVDPGVATSKGRRPGARRCAVTEVGGSQCTARSSHLAFDDLTTNVLSLPFRGRR